MLGVWEFVFGGFNFGFGVRSCLSGNWVGGSSLGFGVNELSGYLGGGGVVVVLGGDI